MNQQETATYMMWRHDSLASKMPYKKRYSLCNALKGIDACNQFITGAIICSSSLKHVIMMLSADIKLKPNYHLIAVLTQKAQGIDMRYNLLFF